MFAQAVLEEAAGAPATVFIQDYQFALLPRMLKQHNPSLRVMQFWHIPFPSPEVVRMLPWAQEMLDGMTANDVLGFHLEQYQQNFTEACRVIMHRGPGVTNASGAARGTRVCAVPIGIDFEAHAQQARSVEVDIAMSSWRRRLGSVRRIALAIDRIDYTKGVPERLRAIRSLLQRYPSLKGEFSFVQVAVPTRAGIAEYSDLERQICAEAGRINEEFGTAVWQPVLLEKRNLPAAEMMALHRLASICLVTPLHDGMNLVAKEFVASRFDEDGVLVLSAFAGCATELTSAVRVNPFCEQELIGAILKAFSMRGEERVRRMRKARAAVMSGNVYWWAGRLFTELAHARPFKTRPFIRMDRQNIAANVA